MTLIYENGTKKYTIEELAQIYPKEWKEAITESYKTWGFSYKCALNDIISEAADDFQNTLWEKNVDIDFKDGNEKPYDLNILLNDIRRW